MKGIDFYLFSLFVDVEIQLELFDSDAFCQLLLIIFCVRKIFKFDSQVRWSFRTSVDHFVQIVAVKLHISQYHDEDYGHWETQPHLDPSKVQVGLLAL